MIIFCNRITYRTVRVVLKVIPQIRKTVQVRDINKKSSPIRENTEHLSPHTFGLAVIHGIAIHLPTDRFVLILPAEPAGYLPSRDYVCLIHLHIFKSNFVFSTNSSINVC